MRGTSLLLACGLLAAATATVGFAVRVPCPECLGEGLVKEPPADAWKTRWVRARDLVPTECPSCSDRLKVSLFQAWRSGPVRPPERPIYRAGQTQAFTDKRRLQASFFRDEARGANRSDLLPLLTGALDDEDRDVRALAIEGITYLKDEKALPVLLGALSHQDKFVQVRACIGLGWLGVREGIIPALKKAGDSADPDVRLTAATALFELGALRSADAFLQALKEKRVYWEDARKVFVYFQRKETTFALIKQMAKVPPNLVADYGQDLEHLTGEKFGDDPVKWYRWFEKNRDSYPPQIE